MSTHSKAAIVATAVLAALMCFQLLLAAGLPLGRAAWGGGHRVLPGSLRWGSLGAVAILGLAAWIVLARAGLVSPGAAPKAVRIATWVFGGYFALNTVMNVLSVSPPERYAMTPASATLVVCFFLVARS
jgi:hypothetical protein